MLFRSAVLCVCSDVPFFEAHSLEIVYLSVSESLDRQDKIKQRKGIRKGMKRMMEEKNLYGLSSQEVQERERRGEKGAAAERITKTTGQIIRENVCTLFNFLNFLIAVLLFAVGAYSNMLFICIIILNIVIGIFQELKAKKLVDELAILNRPSVRVRRVEVQTAFHHSLFLQSTIHG